MCERCGATFTRGDNYLVAPAASDLTGRDTHYAGAAFATTLGYQQVTRPYLGAAVRQRWLRRWLFDRPQASVLEIGCGDGRFAYWNRDRAHIVGLDTVPLFSAQARQSVDLIQGDARRLPFTDGTFTAAYSIDVFEHLDLAGLTATLAEARRVLAPGGLFFVFTNSREPSFFEPVINAQRRLSRALRQRGIGDFAADDLRKGDHVKALATYEDFVRLAAEHRFAVRAARFWNGVAQGFIDNVLVRVGEHVLLRRGQPRIMMAGATATARSRGATARQEASQRRSVALVLTGLTWAMQADVALLGGFRSGPFFALLERR